MNKEAGAFIERDGVIEPDTTDEAMVGRQPKEENPITPAKGGKEKC